LKKTIQSFTTFPTIQDTGLRIVFTLSRIDINKTSNDGFISFILITGLKKSNNDTLYGQSLCFVFERNLELLNVPGINMYQ